MNTKIKTLNISLLILIMIFGIAGHVDAAKNIEKVNTIKSSQVHTRGNIKGTITSINNNKITVDIKNKKTTVSQTVLLDSKTKFNVKKPRSTKGVPKTTASISNFKVGDKVNINGKSNDDGTITALILRLTPPKNKKN
jgi:preprotein translocase subunit YajC